MDPINYKWCLPKEKHTRIVKAQRRAGKKPRYFLWTSAWITNNEIYRLVSIKLLYTTNYTPYVQSLSKKALKNKIGCVSCMGSAGDLLLQLHVTVRNARVLLIFKTDNKSIVSYLYPPFENPTEYTVCVILQAFVIIAWIRA